jgi:hypothetical protein
VSALEPHPLERTTVQRIRRIAFTILAADFLVLAALGTWLAFRYEPTSSFVSTVHGVLGFIAVLAALAAAIATVADGERSTAGVLPAVVVFGVVAAMYVTGPTLAWDELSVNGPLAHTRGVTVAFDDHVGAVTHDNETMTAQQYRRIAWLHVGALPIAVVCMGGAGVWAVRRRRYVPQRLADPAPPDAD